MLRTARNTVLSLALFASALAAQSEDRGRVGLGVALNPIALGDVDGSFAVLPVGLGNFTVPIWVSERVRVEPELGIARATSESSGGGFSSQSTNTLLRYGAAVHFLFGGSGSLRPYIGPRAGFVRETSRYETTGNPVQESKRTDHYVGVAIGGEYWFTPRFSLGAEVQVNRIGLGEQEFTPQPPSSSSSSSSVLSNNGVIAVRFYF